MLAPLLARGNSWFKADDWIDEQTEKVSAQLVFLTRNFGVITVIGIDAEISTVTKVTYSMQHLQPLEDGELLRYRITVGLTFVCIVVFYSNSFMQMYRPPRNPDPKAMVVF